MQESLNTDMNKIVSAGLEEILLVRKAIDYYENLKLIGASLREGRLRGLPGQLDIQVKTAA